MGPLSLWRRDSNLSRTFHSRRPSPRVGTREAASIASYLPRFIIPHFTRYEGTHVELSAEMFRSVLVGLKSERPGGETEHRKSPRVQLRAKLKIMLPSENEVVAADAQLHNLSSGGIAIRMPTELSVRSKFVVQIPSGTGAPLTLLCTVRNARFVRREGWLMEMFVHGGDIQHNAQTDRRVANPTDDRRAGNDRTHPPGDSRLAAISATPCGRRSST